MYQGDFPLLWNPKIEPEEEEDSQDVEEILTKYLNMPKQIKNNPYSFVPNQNKKKVNKVAPLQQNVEKQNFSSKMNIPSERKNIKVQNSNKKHHFTQIAEATFKPYDLKQNLKSLKKIDFSKILAKEIKKEENKPRSSRKKVISRTKKYDYLYENKEPKTKYQQILQSYFEKNSYNNTQKNPIQSKKRGYCLSRPVYSERKVQTQRKGQSYKQKTLKRTLSITNQPSLKKNLNKTRCSSCRSYGKVKTEGNQSEPVKKNNWMTLTFHDRQQRTLQNKILKRDLANLEKKQKQLEGCTFKPQFCHYQHSKKVDQGKLIEQKEYANIWKKKLQAPIRK